MVTSVTESHAHSYLGGKVRRLALTLWVDTQHIGSQKQLVFSSWCLNELAVSQIEIMWVFMGCPGSSEGIRIRKRKNIPEVSDLKRFYSILVHLPPFAGLPPICQPPKGCVICHLPGKYFGGELPTTLQCSTPPWATTLPLATHKYLGPHAFSSLNFFFYNISMY